MENKLREIDSLRRKIEFETTPSGLKGMREWLGLTQQQFAQQVGVAQSYVSRVENSKGYKHISWKYLFKIQKAFDAVLTAPDFGFLKDIADDK